MKISQLKTTLLWLSSFFAGTAPLFIFSREKRETRHLGDCWWGDWRMLGEACMKIWWALSRRFFFFLIFELCYVSYNSRVGLENFGKGVRERNLRVVRLLPRAARVTSLSWETFILGVLLTTIILQRERNWLPSWVRHFVTFWLDVGACVVRHAN